MKKTLLIAAAALVAGIVSSEAQVYSANVVGYVNTVLPAGQYVLVANPLTTGNDVLTNVLGTQTGITGGSQAQIWNSGLATFQTYTYSVSGGVGHWKRGTLNSDNTPMPPGIGFFLYNSTTTLTNTWVGTVVANAGATATNSLPNVITPVGSLLPYGDSVTNASTINLTVGGGTQLQQWNVAGQKFLTYTYQSSGNWKRGTLTTNPVVQVAEGFFINASPATNWIQTLP